MSEYEISIDTLESMMEVFFEHIKQLENRIIELELNLVKSSMPNAPDGWYFDY